MLDNAVATGALGCAEADAAVAVAPGAAADAAAYADAVERGAGSYGGAADDFAAKTRQIFARTVERNRRLPLLFV